MYVPQLIVSPTPVWETFPWDSMVLSVNVLLRISLTIDNGDLKNTTLNKTVIFHSHKRSMEVGSLGLRWWLPRYLGSRCLPSFIPLTPGCGTHILGWLFRKQPETPALSSRKEEGDEEGQGLPTLRKIFWKSHRILLITSQGLGVCTWLYLD